MVNERELLLDVMQFVDEMAIPAIEGGEYTADEIDRIALGLQEMYDKLEDGD
jgi:hypothetical protein